MIELIRKNKGMNIKEFRYPKELFIDKNFDITKIYSFKDIETDWKKEKVCSMMIDLTKSEEELFKIMNKNYRNQIRKEKIIFNIVRATKEEEYKEFYNNLHVKFYKENKLKPYPYEYLRQGELWYSKKDGKIISGSIIFSDEEYASQSFASAEHITFNGHRLLIWTTIKYYKEKGLKWFNFGGGESDYKRRFGSEKFDVFTYYNYYSKKAKLLNKLRNLIEC